MSTLWAIRVSLHHLARVGELRSMSGVRAAIVGDILWLRGEGLDNAFQRVLAPIAEGPVFQLATDGRLTPFGLAVPIERLPEAEWKPLKEILTPVLPSPALATFQIPRVPLALERTTAEQGATLLVTDWLSFRDWAVAAPEVRLQRCRFAVCRNSSSATRDSTGSIHRVAILGQPLPPLPGERFWLAGSVAIPLGFHWVPHVDVKTLEAVFARGSDETSPRIHLWHAKQNLVEAIVSSDLVPVSRANVRATDAAMIQSLH